MKKLLVAFFAIVFMLFSGNAHAQYFGQADRDGQHGQGDQGNHYGQYGQGDQGNHYGQYGEGEHGGQHGDGDRNDNHGSSPIPEPATMLLLGLGLSGLGFLWKKKK